MIYVFLANGFEEIEALTPVDILRRSGLQVKTVGVTGSAVCGAHNILVNADICLDDVNIDDADMFFLPGGMPGTLNLQKCKELEKLIINANAKGIYIAAICAAPMILGELGLLDGKKAICFPGFEKHLKGAYVTDSSVVIDKNFITSKGAGTAAALGFKMIEILKDKTSADELFASMQYQS